MPVPSGYDTELYTLGRGVIWLAAWSGSVAPVLGAYKDVGNAPDFSLEPTEEVLDHFSSRSGKKTKDKQTTLESGATALFTIDSISVENFRLFLSGTTDTRGTTISLNTSLSAEYGLRFISANAEGQNYRLELWKCRIRAGGAYGFISEDWGSLSYTAEVLSDSTNHATSEFGDLTFVTTTTTSTTTSPP